jgi:hypothetical protein
LISQINLMLNNKNIWFLGIGLAVIMTRLLPHLPNFTIVSAAILFGATIYRKWSFMALVLVAYGIADLFINNYIYPNPGSFKWVSGGLIWIILPMIINFIILRKVYPSEIKPLGIFGAAGLSALVFFIMSNFGVFLMDSLYPKNGLGLVSCYFNALPYLASELAGCLFYSSVLYSIYWLTQDNKSHISEYAGA